MIKMKINISNLIKNEEDTLSIKLEEKLEDLETENTECVFFGPVKFTGQLFNAGGVFNLKGRLEADYNVKCYRCACDISSHIDIPVKENIMKADSKTQDEEDVYTFEGNYIELGDILRANIILNLPMKQLCSENCKGLCHLCGANLNEEQCDCKEENSDSRLEALKGFFNSEQPDEEV